VFKNFNLEEKDFGGLKGRVGLKNLGNTCYMNSGLQCLSNTREMTEYFMKADFKSHINYSNPLGTKGNLACTYAELIREIWTGNSEAVSPFKLKKIIGNFATQFAGFGQQDSQ
jgi:ubiquitin C-terminal hydrolase